MPAFEGFAYEDFAVFEIEGFADRMPQVRERVKPKLMAIGAALAEPLADILDEPLYAHVAQHLRRTVNPPVETWAAFAKEKRAYKPYVHLRVAVSVEKVRVMVFVEDYAEEKTRFARNLARNAESLSRYLTHHPAIRAYDIRGEDDAPLSGSRLTPEVLRDFGERMERIKGQHAAFGIQFDRDHSLLLNGPEFLLAIRDAAHALKPLYACGSLENFDYHYTPDIVNIA